MNGRKKIVVLDDDESLALMVAEFLSADYDVVIGRNGKEGLRLCRAGGVSLVITDIGMPEMDGAGFLQELRKSPIASSIPVIVLTATHFNRTNRRAFERHPQVKAVICKPFDPEDIIGRVNAILGSP